MAEIMEMEMEFSDGEETKDVAHVPATFVPPFSVPAYDGAAVVAARGSLAGALEKRKEMDVHEQLPGYVFMCNGKTKPDCYRYRVFGLPKGRKDIVENIKPGMKLFLYDFEHRLLYGIYEATAGGKLNIEPNAFGRKFPAQVGFRIVKNCYPLPESTFKLVIQENYQGAKFKQELNPHQVMSLLSLFRSFTAPELDLVPPRSASIALQSEVKLLGLDNQFQPQTRELSFEERYIAARQLKLASSGLDPLSVRLAGPWRHSHMAPSVQHSYSRQTNSMIPPREPLGVSNLLRDPSQSAIRDPQLKYLTILSNIRRYGTDPERVTSENEYNPAMPSGHAHYASLSSGNGYYPSTSSGNEFPSIHSVSGNGYYPPTSSGQQPEISPTNYYHQQASTATNAAVSMQSDMQTLGHVSQSPTITTCYSPLTNDQAVVNAPQPPAEAVGYAPQPHTGAIGYTPQSHPVAMVDNTRSYAGATEYTQQHYAGTVGYAPQSHPVATVDSTQSYAGATEYTQQHHAGTIGYTPQSHPGAMVDNAQSYTGATECTQQQHIGTFGYNPQSHPGALADNTRPYGAAFAYTQQQHYGTIGYTHTPQLYTGATGYTPQSHAAAIGYAPQIHAEAVGYTQQPVETRAAVVGASGTAGWNVATGSYTGANDWNAVNQYYYSYTAGATTSHNQTT